MRIVRPGIDGMSEIAPAVKDPATSRTATKGQQVERAIRSYLASGEIGPGEKISLRKLAV